MRLAITPNVASVGNVNIHETFRVIELDAGHAVETTQSVGLNDRSDSISFSREALNSIETQLAIIVPCKDEEVSILDGVLRGIPRDCLIILVSNSKRTSFTAECTLLSEFCVDTHRSGIMAHQHDVGVARAFIAAGMPEIVREVDGRPQIRNGKGEAMMIGTALAKLAGRKFVGFIDADNLVAGAVHEYCKVYAAGLHYALHCTDHGDGSDTTTPHSMVRIKWNSKPKVKDGVIVFEKSGRSSRVVNYWMNRLLSELEVDHNEHNLIETGNAGEHAMSIDYALDMQFATGYAVEPHQYIDTWERLGGLPADLESRLTSHIQQLYNVDLTDDHIMYNSSDDSTPTSSISVSRLASPRFASPVRELPAAKCVRILQVETRNPHFHDTSKGADHISAMQAGGLSTIYHSRLISANLKAELREYFKTNLSDVNSVAEDGTPQAPLSYPAMRALNFDILRSIIVVHSETFKVAGKQGNTVF